MEYNELTFSLLNKYDEIIQEISRLQGESQIEQKCWRKYDKMYIFPAKLISKTQEKERKFPFLIIRMQGTFIFFI